MNGHAHKAALVAARPAPAGHPHFGQANHTLRSSFANYMILLPLTSICNLSHSLFAWVCQLSLGSHHKLLPLLLPAPPGQGQAAAHSPHTPRCKRSLCAPLGLQDRKTELFLLSCISFWQWYPSRRSRQSLGKDAAGCAYLSMASSWRGPGWRSSPWDTAMFWVGARGRQAHLVLDV